MAPAWLHGPGRANFCAALTDEASGAAAIEAPPRMVIRTLTPSFGLPDSSLFQAHPEPSARYLVETDSRFTGGSAWLSSDYLLAALAVDALGSRNVIGLARELPVPEMEKLILANTRVGDEDVRLLGQLRAQAVKSWLIEKGQVPAERVFVLSTQEGDDGKQPKARISRVDFSLR